MAAKRAQISKEQVAAVLTVLQLSRGKRVYLGKILDGGNIPGTAPTWERVLLATGFLVKEKDRPATVTTKLDEMVTQANIDRVHKAYTNPPKKKRKAAKASSGANALTAQAFQILAEEMVGDVAATVAPLADHIRYLEAAFHGKDTPNNTIEEKLNGILNIVHAQQKMLATQQELLIEIATKLEDK